ncbi:hypothetical protein BDP27DRAFT_1428913 [Rhodocollybia butyracea]|uniref:Uncharacterized protein n=1 Tax=Rhodocollybia butyracea TaxID=206335 RepID=A0A9P5PAQ6_9AGAR|nr:hypothetical protein BDP27DRAFT_1428913 [Rhodocollybia butyracea]
MRFATPLLFSLIASSILAVCSLPVDERPERPMGLAIQQRRKNKVTVTFIDHETDVLRGGSSPLGAVYMGISKGPPGRNRFKSIMGEPPEVKTDRLSKDKEWGLIWDEFNLQFMAPQAGLSSTGEGHATVTFIDITGAEQGTGDTKFRSKRESSMTEALNALDNTKAEIAYKGSYAPSKDNRQWVYFKITGLPVECTDANPCFGWFAGGLVPGGMRPDPNEWYTAISKGKPGQDHFVPFKGEPSEEGEKAKEKAEKMAEEWKTILAEFQKLYKPT